MAQKKIVVDGMRLWFNKDTCTVNPVKPTQGKWALLFKKAAARGGKFELKFAGLETMGHADVVLRSTECKRLR